MHYGIEITLMNILQEPNTFAVLGCESSWLDVQMENIEQWSDRLSLSDTDERVVVMKK